MTTTIASAAVIGAGSMGSGIAAQFANAGIPVLLMDVAADAGPRNAAAEAGIARQLKAGGFMHPSRAALVTPCNTTDDITRLGGADWIVEAVVEDLAIKRDLFARVDAARAPHSIVSSNTSTIPLAKMIEGQSARFARDFLITHFFNPPRVMQLLEVVAGPATSEAAATTIAEAGEAVLGKTVLACRDTPGFVANRIGCFWIAVAIMEAQRLGLTIEEADAVAGAPFRIPPIGPFGVLDLVGVDLVPHVWGSLQSLLPQSDLLWAYNLTAEPLTRRMIARGLLGRKSGAGFYRLIRDGARRGREVLDMASCEFRPERPVDLPSLAAHGRDLRRLCEQEDKAGRYAWRVLSQLVRYCAAVGPEIAGSVADVDLGMRLGYGWAEGPFQIADRVGAGWIAERLRAEGAEVPKLLADAASAGGFYAGAAALAAPAGSVAALRRGVVFENAGAALLDIGDGVACLEHRTKMNVFSPEVFEVLGVALAEVPKQFQALVIGNDHPRAFSAGADLSVLLARIKSGDWAAIEAFLAIGQERFLALKYAAFPVVGAAFGLALGGGCEVLLHCREVVAHADLAIGLPETAVGLIPSWGGCTQLLARWARAPGGAGGPLAAAAVFPLIMGARVSTSALDARDLGTLGARDGIVMSRRRLLATAKARALALVGTPAPVPEALALAGPAGKAALLDGLRGQPAPPSEADLAIAEALATVLTGGATAPGVAMTEAQAMALEREAVLAVARRQGTVARIEHMLATGKPLRN